MLFDLRASLLDIEDQVWLYLPSYVEEKGEKGLENKRKEGLEWAGEPRNVGETI